MCLGWEVLEACASLFDINTGEFGVLKTCFDEEADGGGLSMSSMLRTGACGTDLGGPPGESAC